jgi:LysR family transcriptional regulator, nitrogen assimilation regulatory protein
MDIRQIRYFIAIVEAGSFLRASEKLRVAQPALSQHIRSMEAEFGVPLLLRSARGVVPTEEGLRLLDRARIIDAQFSSLHDHIRGQEARPSGEVRFGMPGTVSEQLSVPLIENARKALPDVRIRVVEAMSGFVGDWLRAGSLDIAILYKLVDSGGLATHHALTEGIQLFGSTAFRPLPAGDDIRLSALLDLPLIVPSPFHGLRKLIDTAANSIGRSVNPTIEIDSYRQIKRLVRCGMGFGLLPAMAIEQDVAGGKFRSWRVTRPLLARQLLLAYRKDQPLSLAARAIGQLSWTMLQEMALNGHWNATWSSKDDIDLYHPSEGSLHLKRTR